MNWFGIFSNENWYDRRIRELRKVQAEYQRHIDDAPKQIAEVESLIADFERLKRENEEQPNDRHG